MIDLETKQLIYSFEAAHSGMASAPHVELNSVIDPIYAVAISSDNRTIVSGSTDKSIKMFDIKTKNQLYYFKDIHAGRINALAISNNNKFIVSGSADKTIKVFDLQTKQELYHFNDIHSGRPYLTPLSNIS